MQLFERYTIMNYVSDETENDNVEKCRLLLSG